MSTRCLCLLLLGCALSSAPGYADVVELKDQASLTGNILAEKPDLVVMDLGFTVLSVPRDRIIKITRTTDAAPGRDPVASPPPPPPPTPSPRGRYTTPHAPPPGRAGRGWGKQWGEAVVQVRTPSGLGSGFFIHADGHLITNFHVIENETQISLEVYHQANGQLDRRSYKQIRIVALNKFADLALLKVEDKDAPLFSRVILGDSEALAVGERVFAIGSPLGLERTVTEGIVSTKTRQLQGDLYLQTTAQINPGNSGGPLFNLRGEVVGVTNMKINLGEGLGFAIPAATLKFFLHNRDAFAYDNDNPSNPYRYLEPPSRLKQNL